MPHWTLLMRQIQPSSVTDIARIYCKTENCLVCAQRPRRRSYSSISAEKCRILFLQADSLPFRSKYLIGRIANPVADGTVTL